MKKIIACTLALLTLCCLLVSCLTVDVRKAEETQFSKDGMTITLTKAFVEKTKEDLKDSAESAFNVCYDSMKVAVFVLKEPFSTVPGSQNQTLDWYAEAAHKANESRSPEDIQKTDGLTYFEYTFQNESTNKDYRYLTVLYKGPDAFWMVQFATLVSDYEEYKPDLIKWANTVTFDNA